MKTIVAGVLSAALVLAIAGPASAAEKRNKAEAKVADRCERARRDLARAIEMRNAVDTRTATIEQMQKASGEVSRREAELPKACPT